MQAGATGATPARSGPKARAPCAPAGDAGRAVRIGARLPPPSRMEPGTPRCAHVL